MASTYRVLVVLTRSLTFHRAMIIGHLLPGHYRCEHAGAFRFLERLRTALATGVMRPRKIVLVGHGAGAIYVTEFLRRAALELDGRQQFEVVLLAAAVSYIDFSQMWQEVGAHISNFRVFAMNDSVEITDSVSRYYARSLLYLVSTVFEPDPDEPLLGLARYLDEAIIAQIGDPFRRATVRYVLACLNQRFGQLRDNVFVLSPTRIAPRGAEQTRYGKHSSAVDNVRMGEDPETGAIDSVCELIRLDSQQKWS